MMIDEIFILQYIVITDKMQNMFVFHDSTFWLYRIFLIEINCKILTNPNREYIMVSYNEEEKCIE